MHVITDPACRHFIGFTPRRLRGRGCSSCHPGPGARATGCRRLLDAAASRGRWRSHALRPPVLRDLQVLGALTALAVLGAALIALGRSWRD